MFLKEKREQFESGFLPKQEFIEKMYTAHSVLFDYAEYLGCTGIDRIEIVDGNVIFVEKDSQARFLCKRGDLRLPQIESLNFGAYEPEVADVMFQLLAPGMKIFDIGANVGWFSVQFAKNDSSAGVYAFEPIEDTFRWLKKNAVLNETPNLKLYNFGLGNESGPVEFFVYPECSGGSSMADNSKRSSVEKIKCQIKRMDDFCDEANVWPDFIKCDVEGAELFVFKGGSKAIDKSKPIIVTEMLRKWSASFGYHPNDIIAFLTGKGYDCFVIREGTLLPFTEVDESTVDTNFVFLHKIMHREIISAMAPNPR